jgi:hypothetical protein
LSFGIINAVLGLSPIWYHLFSIVLHTLNVLVVFYFIKYLLYLSTKSTRKPQIPQNQHRTVAFITAFFFAIHPMQVGAVAWISASKVLLYSLLFLWSLIFYMRYIDRRRWYYFLLSVMLFLVSFGAKEQTLILPCCLIAIDYFFWRDISSKKIIAEKPRFFIIALVLGFIEISATNAIFHKLLTRFYYPLGQRIILANFVLIKYLAKLLVPFKLSESYPFPMAPGSALPVQYYVYPVFVIALLIFLYRCFKAGKYYIIFGAAFCILNLLLALGIIPMARRALMADRYVYISTIGLFFVLTITGINLFNRLHPDRQKAFLVLIGIYVVFLMASTGYYVHRWV